MFVNMGPLDWESSTLTARFAGDSSYDLSSGSFSLIGAAVEIVSDNVVLDCVWCCSMQSTFDLE